MNFKKCLLIIFLTGLTAFAAETGSLTPLTRDKILALMDYPGVEAFYQDLHKNPELSNEEKRTAAKVAKELKQLGFGVTEGIGGNGVVGVYMNGPGPTALIRTELDGLPVQEETRLPYTSEVKGVMHACGHDVHMAAFLGTANVLLKTKNLWKGTLLFVAQPAEELGRGAYQMVRDPVFKNLPKPNYTLALHIMGELPAGQIAYRPGPLMASNDDVALTVYGRGGHGAFPHKTIDPIHLAAEIIIKLQTVISREVDAVEPVVISTGSIHGGTKSNIIPDSVELKMTLRTFDPNLKEEMKKRIVEVAEGLAKLAHAPAPKIEFSNSTPVVYNDPATTSRLLPIFQAAVGEKSVHEIKPVMGAEDYGVFSQSANVPGVMFFVGQQKAGESPPFPFNHSAKFAPDFKPTVESSVTALVLSVIEMQKTNVDP